MHDPAFTLAALRAGGAYTVSERERSAAEIVAAQLGRRVVELHAERGGASVTLGFAEGHEPNPDEDVFSVRRLSPIPLVGLATCLGLCWTDLDQRPYPGEPVEITHVLDVAAALGASRSHLLGAMRNDLTMAGLVEMDDSTVRLGHAIAAWTDAQLDALRRFSDALPRNDD
jgi:antitoxin (DNA-binding transcriptional repressor) of toxin-antitoxin stability system